MGHIFHRLGLGRIYFTNKEFTPPGVSLVLVRSRAILSYTLPFALLLTRGLSALRNKQRSSEYSLIYPVEL